MQIIWEKRFYFSIKVNKTVRRHNPHSASTFCMKQLPPVALITRAWLALFCLHSISQLCSWIYSFFHATYHSLLRPRNVLKESAWTAKKKLKLGPKKKTKAEFLKDTWRKLWLTAARDRAYSYLYSYPAYFSWFFPFLTSCENISKKACWSSTRWMWLLYCYCLGIPWKSFCLLLTPGVPWFHWLAAYSLDIHPSKGLTCLQLFKRR